MDVVVYPPLSLADWTLDDLSERIAEVRQLYLDTLKDWPVGKVPDAIRYVRNKAPAKKAPAKKAPAKKAPAKKAPAKKAPAKKAPAKKTPRRRRPRPEESGRPE